MKFPGNLRMSLVTVAGLVAGPVAMAGCLSKAPDEVLFVRGSDTMRPLIEDWGEQFAAVSSTEVAFGGGGSGVGMYALLNGLVDIGASSRPITPKERRVADRKSLEVYEFRVALDGIAVVVHPSNPVPRLSMAQLAAVFTGTATTWSRVGGPDRPISVLSREARSGTHHFFKGHVLPGQDFSGQARIVPSNAAVVSAVAADPGAVGYVGLGFAEHARTDVRIVPLHHGEAPASLPSPASVASGEYPLSRALYLYTAVRPTGEVAQFIEYVRSAKGQARVTATGFVPTVLGASEGQPPAASSEPAEGSPG